MRDGWRLAVGTLTVLPVRPPDAVTSGTARSAVLLAPLAAVPLGLAVAAVGLLGQHTAVPPLALGLLALGVLALGTRALHWDGLSDVADGLTASYDPERSLAVMKSGTSGPAGVLATVVVAGLQVVGLASLLGSARGAVLAAVAVCASRAALAVTCVRGVPAARREGLGQPLAGVVPPVLTAATWILVAAALGAGAWWADLSWWRGPVAAVVALTVVLVLVRRTRRRFGGVTGDVFGAAVEAALAAMLVCLA